MHPHSIPNALCAQCGIAFHVKPSRLARAVYCSKACYDVVRAGLRMPPNCICETCGTLFYASPSRLRDGGKLCSMACRTRDTLARRFWCKVCKTEHCWLWSGSTNQSGYGKLSRGGKNGPLIAAHHAAWELATGVVLDDEAVIMHTCDTPRCVRNDEPGWYEVRGVLLPRNGHLVLGTLATNAQDAADKGRSIGWSWAKGRKRTGLRGPYLPV